jgi:hypothetical protein
MKIFAVMKTPDPVDERTLVMNGAHRKMPQQRELQSQTMNERG